jgi:dethiobiotin synthetase
MIGCFVTGTDTGVGKTLVSAGLLHALAPRHRRVVGMKPVAAGVVPWGEDWASEDAIALRSAGVRIDIAAIVRSYQALAAQADAVVVEGAGGFHVPLSDTETGADLAQALALPVVLVVGLRLGCLNHALLTAEAIRTRGLALAGWVANRVDPGMDAAEENIAYLRERLGAPLLAEVPYQELPDARGLVFELPGEWL